MITRQKLGHPDLLYGDNRPPKKWAWSWQVEPVGYFDFISTNQREVGFHAMFAAAA